MLKRNSKMNLEELKVWLYKQSEISIEKYHLSRGRIGEAYHDGKIVAYGDMINKIERLQEQEKAEEQTEDYYPYIEPNPKEVDKILKDFEIKYKLVEKLKAILSKEEKRLLGWDK